MRLDSNPGLARGAEAADHCHGTTLPPVGVRLRGALQVQVPRATSRWTHLRGQGTI